MTTDSGKYYYLADGLGTITTLTNSDQKIVQEYEYDVFGNPHGENNTVKQPYTFTGREWDKETKLYYYRARYYDAEVGRFISEDPILHPKSSHYDVAGTCGTTSRSKTPFEYLIENPLNLNPYVYVANNPIRYTDPTGLSSTYICIRVYFSEDFICHKVEDTCPPKITDLGIFNIKNAPCIMTCYFSESEWQTGIFSGSNGM